MFDRIECIINKEEYYWRLIKTNFERGKLKKNKKFIHIENGIKYFKRK